MMLDKSFLSRLRLNYVWIAQNTFPYRPRLSEGRCGLCSKCDGFLGFGLSTHKRVQHLTLTACHVFLDLQSWCLELNIMRPSMRQVMQTGNTSHYWHWSKHLEQSFFLVCILCFTEWVRSLLTVILCPFLGKDLEGTKFASFCTCLGESLHALPILKQWTEESTTKPLDQVAIFDIDRHSA